MQLVVVLLSLSLLLLGGVAFVAFARPEYLLGWVAWWTGRGEEWRKNELHESEHQHFFALIFRSYPLLLLMVFAWAFVVGSVLALSRL